MASIVNDTENNIFINQYYLRYLSFVFNFRLWSEFLTISKLKDTP